MKLHPTIFLPPSDRPLCGLSRTNFQELYLRPKGTALWSLTITFQGKAEYQLPNRLSVPLSAGKMILIQSGKPQSFQKKGTPHWVVGWAHFLPDPAWISLLNWPSPANGFWVFDPPTKAITQRILRDFRQILAVSQKNSPLANQKLLHAIQGLFLYTCEVLHRKSKGSDPRIQTTIKWIDHHFNQPFSLKGLASSACLSIPQYLRLFQKTVGLSPRKYLEYRRIEEAKKQLLTTSKSLTEISNEIGFQNLFYFSTRFKKATTQSPSSFRNLPSRTYQPQISG